MEHARKYRYIETNPARDVITKFGKQGKTPDPYTIEQMQNFMAHILGTKWEMPVVLAGMYGLRISEILGLEKSKIDLKNMRFSVDEQLPFNLPAGTKFIEKLAPTKSNDRVLPITEETLPYFIRQFNLIESQKNMIVASGGEYYDNDLFIAKPDGSPYRRDRMSSNFGQLIRHLEMPHLRFHDLRHPYVKLKLKFLLTQHYRCIGAKVLDFPLNFKPVVGVNIHLVYKHICECLCQGVFLFHCFCYLQVF